MLLYNVEKNAEALRRAGRDSIARAKRMGVSVYYEDPRLGAGIFKEAPDGSIQRVEVRDGQEVVLETLDLKR